MRIYLWVSILVFGVGHLFSSCSEEFSSRMDPLANALGNASQITVISDEALWSGPPGDTFNYYFGSAYPILPQPEPLFDIRHYSSEELQKDKLRKELRTYVILANLSDETSPTTKMAIKDLGETKVNKAKSDPDYHMAVGYDRWARGQMVVYLFANTESELIDQIKIRYPSIAQRVHTFDEEKLLATVYLSGSDSELSQLVEKTYALKMDVPKDYFLAINEGKTIWLRKETDFLSSNILMTEVPYHNQGQLTKEGIKRIRDSLGVKYVSTTADASYMVVNDQDLPMVTTKLNLGSAYAVEARGIWEMENDFMGGPFMTYVLLSPDNKKIIFIDGFVHAPGKDKRNFMQHLEVIFRGIHFAGTQ